MILAKFCVYDVKVRLFKFEERTGCPVYAVQYYRDDIKSPSFAHNSISYTREQAFHIFETFCLYLVKRYRYY